MVGKYDISISTRRVRYDFSIKRKYTIINGDSGSGKTRLVKLIRGASRNRQIKIISGARVVGVLSVDDLYREIDKGYVEPVIYFIDEDVCRDLLVRDSGMEFARKTAEAEGYFVLISRASFPCIPYSVLEIYNIVGREEGRLKLYWFERTYTWIDSEKVSPDFVLTEDSRVGYLFFNKTLGNICSVKSAFGKSKIPNALEEYKEQVGILLIIADGASFGSDIERLFDAVARITRSGKLKVRLYFPESFEYVILNSGVFKVEDSVLKRTYDFADSVKFLSWERYYTYLLWKVSNKEYGKSQKSLPRFLESKRNVEKFIIP